MFLENEHTYKNKKILVGVFVVLMLIVDFLQYDISITNHIYTVLLMAIIFFALVLKKISRGYVYIFVLFLLFQDLSRYFYTEHNFNSPFFGSLKYVFIGITILIALSNGAIKNKKFNIYIGFATIVLAISILKGQVNEYIAKDIVFYFNIFLLPILISYILNEYDCKSILKIYDVFVYAFPIFTLILLVLNRAYNMQGSLYTIVGNISLMNLAYLVGIILKENSKIKIKNYIYILVYFGLYFFAPSSGGILVIVAIGIYYVIRKTSKVSWVSKGIVFIILMIVLGILIRTGFNYILESPKYSGTFTRFKILQIQYMFEARSLIELPFSVRVRAAEVLNILHCDNIIDFIFGRGFGGFFTDSLNILGEVAISDNAFSAAELMSGQYFSTHFILNTIFMKFGIIGLILFIKFIVLAYKEFKVNYIEFIPVLIVVVYGYGYGIKLILMFGFIYGSIIKLNRLNYENDIGLHIK